MRRTSSSVATILGLCTILLKHYVLAYPILIEVAQNEQTCLTLNIPEGDDVHFVLTNLPRDVDEDLEYWFMSEIYDLTEHGSSKFMKPPSSPPEKFSKIMNEARHKSTMAVTISSMHSRTKNLQIVPWRINLQKDVFKSMHLHPDDDDDYYDIGSTGAEICFRDNASRGSVPIHAVFEHVIISEIEEKMRNKHIVKKEHLTPIEESFDESILKAREILNEMASMEKRESRMKHTSDDTNTRIRYFSYVSISILLGVTWMQISYLKGYFKKKKIL